MATRKRTLPKSIPGIGCIFQPTYRDKKTGELKHSGIWWMQINTDDGVISRSTKQRDQEAAYSELLRAAGERVSGQIQDTAPERVTFGQLFDLVIADYVRMKKASLPQAKRRMAKHLLPIFGDMKVINLRKADVESFTSRSLKKGLSAATVNRCLSLLRRALQVGADHDPSLVIRRIPKWFVKLDEDNTRTGLISEEMYDALMPHMAPHVQTAFCIGWHLGMRLSEILSLKWEQVDFKTGIIRLKRSQTKAKKPRTAPIYWKMRPVLDMARSAADPICPYVVQDDGKRVYSIKTAWYGAFKRAGLLVDTGRLRKSGESLLKPQALFHDLRRTAATNMDKHNVSQVRIMEIVGWDTPAMFDRYRIGNEKGAVATGRQMEESMALQAERERIETRRQ